MEIAHLDPAPAPAGTVVRAHVTQDAERIWSAQLRVLVGSQQGERVLHAETCPLLVQAAALVVALAIHPEPAAPQPVVEAPPPAPPDESIHRRPVAPHGRPEAPPRGEAAHFLLRPFAAGDVGVVTGPSVAFGLAAGLRYRALRLELSGSWGLARVEPISGAPEGATVRVQTPILGQLRGCFDGRIRRFDLDACGGVEAAEMTGVSTGIASPGSGTSLWVGVFVGGGVGVRILGPLSVRLDLAIGLAPVRPTFQVVPYGDVFRPSLVYGRLIAGPELEWP